MKINTNAELQEKREEIRKFLIENNYQHEFALLTQNAISTLKPIDLNMIYRVLFQSILDSWIQKTSINILERPVCPITSPKKMNQAKIDYRLAMLDYIQQYGIIFMENYHCYCSVAVLEAIANYCEKNLNSH